jgi:prevent-host-death family protein
MVVVYVKIYQFGCHFGIYFYLCKKKMKVMQVVSAREFRANQGKYLIKANEGQSVLLTSRYGNFKIVPISEEDNLTTRICRGLQQVKLIEEGKLPRRTIEDLLDEL